MEFLIPAQATESQAVDFSSLGNLAGLILPLALDGSTLSLLLGPTEDGFPARGELSFQPNTNPTHGQAIHLNNVRVVFVTTPPTGNQVLIGATAADTAANLHAFLLVSPDPSLAELTYDLHGRSVLLTAVAPGTAGNQIPLSVDQGMTAVQAFPASGFLSGGGFRKIENAELPVSPGKLYSLEPLRTPTEAPWLKVQLDAAQAADRVIGGLTST